MLEALAVAGGCALVAVIAIGVELLVAWLFMLLWNFAAVGVFHAPSLTYWYALAIVILLSIIGGFFRSTVTK